MKKILISSLMLGMLAVVVPSAEAKSATAAVTADPQIIVQPGRRYNRHNRYNRRTRVVTSTRVRWVALTGTVKPSELLILGMAGQEP